MRYVTKFFDGVYWLFMTSCKLCFIGMVVLTAYVVLNRHIIKESMTWGEPVVLMCMVYMSLISAALAIRKDTHIRMQIIDFLVSPKVVSVLRVLAHIGVFLFGLFMIRYGWEFTHRVARRNFITGVGIRSTWLYLACPVAGVAICLMEFERCINFFDRLIHGKHLEVGGIREDAKEFVEETAHQLEEAGDGN